METFNNIIIVDSDRDVMVPESLRNAIVQWDHRVLDIIIKVPRFWCGRDLLEHAFYINHIPIKKIKHMEEKGTATPCINVQVTQEDENILQMVWTITSDLSKEPGGFAFLVCAKKVDENNIEKEHWNSRLCKDMIIAEGLETDLKEFVEKNPDLITSILMRINALEQKPSGTPDAVQYVEQELTEEQQEVARENIGAASEEEVLKELGKYALKNEIPSVPVKSVNGKTGAVNLSASDVGARPNTWIPSANEVGADASGTAQTKVSEHNTSETSHNDIRLLIADLTTRLNTIANSEDVDLDQLAELVAYIKSNRSLIEEITTNKVNVSDIVDNLTTSVSNKPLSAKQGVQLKALIDAIVVPTKTSQLTDDVGFAEQSVVDKLSEEIVDQKSTISRQQAELENKQPKGNYITAIPSEYVTEDELEAEINDLKAQGVQQSPIFLTGDTVENLVKWLQTDGDASKVYVLPDSYIYGYIKTKTEGSTVPNFTNVMKASGAYIKNGYRYSHSSSAFKTCDTDCAVVVPISKGTHIVRVRGAGSGGAYITSFYFGDNNQTFSYLAPDGTFKRTVESNGDIVFNISYTAATITHCVFHVEKGADVNTLIVTVDEEITYTTSEGGTTYKWASTGHKFVPSDYEERIIDAEEKLESHGNRIDNLERNQVTGLSLEHNSCSIFRKVVCCGDSFTAGYIGTTNDNIIQTNWDYAWPSFMARLTGNEYVNCGHSGKDVLTWQTSAKGLPRARTAGKAQAYLIGLGLNDASLVTLGTASDIGTENQTYYGGLSKIIRELNAISPQAKIFVQTIPSDYVVYMNYSQAMRDVVNAYKDTYPVYLLDLYEYKSMYKTSKITGDAIMGHHTAIGYQQFAENLRYIWSDYINNNIAEFQDVYLIPYDETPSTL